MWHHQYSGLKPEEVQVRQQRLGLNQLPQQQGPHPFRIFVSQLTNPFVGVLLLACLVTLFLGDFIDAGIIGLSVLINTVLGFIQEERANHSFEALNKYLTQISTVIRSGQHQLVAAAELVPDDIISLKQGDKVPADAVILLANRASFQEAVLTGESLPVTKDVDQEIFMGSILSSGQVLAKVTRIGQETKVGQIAQQVQSPQTATPLQSELRQFSYRLLGVIASLIVVVFGLGIVRQKPVWEVFTTAVALAVSSIPEGLLISLTAVLAVGMQKILRRKGLVRKLTAAETLGSVSVICVDKTGTLTVGKMTVAQVLGNLQQIAQQVVLANDLDDPLLTTAYDWGLAQLERTKLGNFTQLDSIPFSSATRFFVSLQHNQKANKNILFMNGAPDTVLDVCQLSAAEKKNFQQEILSLTAQGLRVIAFAQKSIPENLTQIQPNLLEAHFEWVGVIAFVDPVRASAKQALETAQAAGIRVIVITGDYAPTAQFVMKELNLPVLEEQIRTGEMLKNMSQDELREVVETTQLFARTTPDQKYALVRALQANGEVVAMMGDGVNDAPALHAADIGICVEQASDVAKESSELVLLNSDFNIITAAIEEGRIIFDNIRKIIFYLLSDAFVEILVVLGALVFQLPLPLTAIQIIWINLISDGLPGLALSIDPGRAKVMHEPPRPLGEPLVPNWMLKLIACVSLLAGGVVLGAFFLSLRQTGSLVIAQSFAFFNFRNLLFGVRFFGPVFAAPLYIKILQEKPVADSGYFNRPTAPNGAVCEPTNPTLLWFNRAVMAVLVSRNFPGLKFVYGYGVEQVNRS